ncbi:MAG: heavy metal translocating P-type ATPase [Cyanobacteriota bacterium ELA615]
MIQTSQLNHDHNHEHEFNLKREAFLVAVVLALFILGRLFQEQLKQTPYSLGQYLVYLPAYLLAGSNVLTSAGVNLLKGRIFDENFLMTIATVGAIAIGRLPEAVGVMLFFRIGELFQESAVARSRRSISSLLEIRPDRANLKTEDGLLSVSPESLKLGQIIVVKPGERIPLDGQIIDGQSQVDTSALSGESMPRYVTLGEKVLAGMINQTGLLNIKVTNLYGDSSIARILDLVQNAGAKKAQTEKFITKFARRYTPIVVIISLLIALLPPLLLPGATYSQWAYRALILLVISCPCGLVISIPVGYFGGVGGAARRGILVKGSTFLDILANLKAVVFDKTGTLTQGVFQVSQIVPYNGFSEQYILKIAALVESNSNHPIAKSLLIAYNREIDENLVSDYKEIAGCGVQATLEGSVILAGNDRLLHRENILHDTCQVKGTVVHLAVDSIYAGYIVIEDKLKADSIKAIRDLKTHGIEQVIMLTGDSQAVAQKIAETLDLDSYQAELLPEEKSTAVETLLGKFGKNGKVAFVGDGINDAPVLARADVGIAMGAMGSDIAIETADVVLMSDSPSKVLEAIQIAQKTRNIVWQNIIFALAIKGIFIILGIFGLANMWEAVFADVGVALLAIFNATRAL